MVKKTEVDWWTDGHLIQKGASHPKLYNVHLILKGSSPPKRCISSCQMNLIQKGASDVLFSPKSKCESQRGSSRISELCFAKPQTWMMKSICPKEVNEKPLLVSSFAITTRYHCGHPTRRSP